MPKLCSICADWCTNLDASFKANANWLAFLARSSSTTVKSTRNLMSLCMDSNRKNRIPTKSERAAVFYNYIIENASKKTKDFNFSISF